MKHPERSDDYLQHILEAIDHITGYVQEIDSAGALERDHKTQAAVIRNIEIIGEAANRPSGRRGDDHPANILLKNPSSFINVPCDTLPNG